jgi:glycosyltransferase involved in cell wall biosynthesis
MTKLPLTTIIITNRADDRFINALKSSQFAEEILIFDDNSNNDWQQLNSLYSFKVIPLIEKINDFAQTRNLALQAASYDWVFFLDSDEVIDPNSTDELEQICTQKTFFNAATVTRNDYFLGKKMNWGEVRKNKIIRLIKKNKIKFQRPVHEKANVPGLTYQTKIVLQHFAHQSINQFLADVSHYAQMEANYRLENLAVSKTTIILQMLIYPTGKFIVNYFFKFGFLDGMGGLIYALMMSIHSMTVRIFIYEKINQK